MFKNRIVCFPACCIYFLPSTESTLGFSDVNCSLFSDSGTEKHNTPSSDEDEIEPLSPVEPPLEGTADGDKKVLETDSNEDDDDIFVSPALHKIEAKNNTNKSKEKIHDEDMQLEDILEPANVHSWRKNDTSDDALKVEDDSVLVMETGKNAPIVERLELPASSDSETENLRRASSDTGLLYRLK